MAEDRVVVLPCTVFILPLPDCVCVCVGGGGGGNTILFGNGVSVGHHVEVVER